jgi:ribosome-associated translation inhibitor RaiA
MEEKSLQQHINDDKDELNNSNINPQRRRHIEDQLDQLERYQANHPDSDHDPNPLELFCDSNPDALECRIYDD